MLESSGGRNDGCLKKGKINGYGYAQHKSNWVCYDTHEEVRSKVKVWFEDKIAKGMEFETSICYYNTGRQIKGCPYYIKYKSL